ncbi:MAG: FHA domain-containing protein [Dermabacter sp.]|nr:FHA domain-containing protein [Dermabacter sp.]
MSELTIVVLRLAFVLALWLFVIVALIVLRNDLFGTTVITRGGAGSKRAGQQEKRTVSDPSAIQNMRTDPQAVSTQLVVTAGQLRGTTIRLAASPILIGRAPECTLVLSDDYASNRHARVFPHDGEWYVEDLGSTNGTLLSGKDITGRAVPFKPGARIKIGTTEIELRRGPK